MDNQEINFDRPSLILRVKSMLLDGVVIIILMFIASAILDSFNIESGLVRGIALFFIILYEPILITIDRTIGQRMTGLRVRKFAKFVDEDITQNINIFASLIRYLTKGLLDWLLLLTIHSNAYGQAIHDKIADSVMTLE